MHEDHTYHDEIAAGRGPGGPAPRPRGATRLFLEVLPPGLHPAPTVCPARSEDLLQDRLARGRPVAGGLRRVAHRPRPGQGPALFHPLLCCPAAPKKGEVVCLLFQATVRAEERGLIDERPEAASDAIGLENR